MMHSAHGKLKGAEGGTEQGTTTELQPGYPSELELGPGPRGRAVRLHANAVEVVVFGRVTIGPLFASHGLLAKKC